MKLTKKKRIMDIYLQRELAQALATKLKGGEICVCICPLKLNSDICRNCGKKVVPLRPPNQLNPEPLSKKAREKEPKCNCENPIKAITGNEKLVCYTCRKPLLIKPEPLKTKDDGMRIKGIFMGIEKDDNQFKTAEIEIFAEGFVKQLTANELCHLHLEIEKIINPQSTEWKCNHIPNASNCHYPLATCTCKPAEKEKGIEYLTNETGYVTVKLIDKINEIIRRINKGG